MYKLLIVDDEPLVRKGISRTINWAKYNIEICGEAINGSDGIKKAKELSPDIIISDVKMPVLDGIEMTKQLNELGINSEIIILSGFGEFDYAKDAITYGVISYLLKPVSNEELVDSVLKAIEKHNAKNNGHLAKGIIDSSIDDLKRKLMRIIIRNEVEDLEKYKQELNFYNLEYIDKGFFVVGVIDEETEENGTDLIELDKIIEKTFKDNNIVFMNSIYHERITFFVSEDNKAIFSNILEKAIEIYSKKEYAKTFSFGVSELFTSLSGIHNAYEEAKRVALNGLMRFTNSIQFYNSNDSKYSLNLIKALDIIHKEYMNDLSVGYVSDKLNVSESYLMHLFKNELNVTFNKVLTNCRIDEAKKLLKTGSYRVNEVAYKVGFNDDKYFTLIFKKITGITPSEYMKK